MFTSEQLKHATKDNPCPHCGKTDWCYSLGDLTVCKRGFDPATGWIRTSKTDKEGDHFYVIERPDSSFTRNGYSSRPSSPPKPPTIELARLPEQPKPLQSETKGSKVITVYPYGPEHQIKRVETFEGDQRTGKQMYQYHLEDDKMVPGKGDLPWNAYRIDEAIRYGKGKGVLIVEGEKCVEAARQNQIAAITWQGSNWTVDQMTADLLKLKIAGVSFVAHEYDHDDAGTKKAEKIVEAGKRADFPTYLIDPVELWSEMPDKGDIVDWVEQVELTPDQRVKQLQKTAKLQTPQPRNHPLAKSKKAIKIEMERELARETIGNQLRFNERTREIEIFCEEMGVVGERFDLDFPDIQLVKYWGLGLELGAKNTEGVIRETAKENSYEPVRDYLEECAEKYRDTNILDNLAETLFGATEPIHQTVFKKTLISAVARVYEPGCKCESVTILYSPRQGINKSRTWETLFGREYFCDNVGDISNKDEVAKLHRVWGCEWSEFENITSKKDVGKIKAFLSTSIDLIREPYGRKCEPISRRAVIVGTTNRDDFLRDDTGNRRFNIIEVNKPEIDISYLKEHRDQVWAAAVHLYKQGEGWWLTASEQKQSNEINEDFRDELPLEQEIADLVAGKDKVTTRWILGEIKSVEMTRYADQQQVTRVISKVLARQGTWKRSKFRDDTGKSVRGYVKVDRKPEEPSSKTVPLTEAVPLDNGTNFGNGTTKRNVPNPSPSSNSGDSVPHVPQKEQVPQKNKNPETHPSPEPIQEQIKNYLREGLISNKRVSQKELFSHFPNHPDEVEVLLKRVENMGRICRRGGYIYSVSSQKFKPGDQVSVTEGDRKSYWGVIQKYNGLSQEQKHSYIVELEIGVRKEPGIYYENQLRKV